ncbi:MAG: hypothetical protein SGARI_004546, partial [Bacillariaceae sp.]
MKFSTVHVVSILVLAAATSSVRAFQSASAPRSRLTQHFSSSNNDNDDKNNSNNLQQASDRRSFLTTTAAGLLAAAATTTLLPQAASAGIDVSGLAVEGGGRASSNPALANQLKAYDGSGSARVREIQQMSGSSVSATTTPRPIAASTSPAAAVDDRSPVATWAYRYNPGVGASLGRAGALRNLYRYEDRLAAPGSSKRNYVGVQFEFPSDWLQLDRAIGGIQYVDQRNGDKLYVMRAPLPPPQDGTNGNVSLLDMPKSYLGDAIFATNGSFQQSGQTVQDYSVSRATTLSDCPAGMCAPHRRFKLKFTTVTGNGLQVERRGLVDAYQVENDIYMIMTSSNAVKFEAKDSRERETVENIVNS